MRTAYLAYPIDKDQPLRPATREVADYAKLVLGKAGALVFDPGAAFHVGDGRRPSRELQEINTQALNRADSVLAVLREGVTSFGVPAEIQYAVSRGTNVAVVLDHEPTWAMPRGSRVSYYQVREGFGWDAAIERAAQWLSKAHPPKRTRAGEENKQAAMSIAPVDNSKYSNLPTRAYPDDAGLDLYVSEDVWLNPSEFKDIPTNVAIELPDWSWGFLTGRSSTLRKKGLMVQTGIIDAGYRGELYIGAWNMLPEPVHVKQGERIGQLIILTNATRRVNPVFVPELNEHDRGTNGFGSSGV